MNKQESIFEREILVSSGEEIGVFKVKLYGERVEGKLVILVTSKFNQNPKEFAEALLKSIESEILKRINVDMVKNVQILMLFNQTVARVVFESDSSIHPNHIEDLDFSYINGLEY
ncbi:MAG: hypothetical protein ACM3KR_06110 [Deltaproteobacteria bacterium]